MRPEKLSRGALSQQFPLRDIDGKMIVLHCLDESFTLADKRIYAKKREAENPIY